MKGQSEDCASESLGIFRTGPEQQGEHWALIFQREDLCVQTWLLGRLWCCKALTLVLPVWAALTLLRIPRYVDPAFIRQWGWQSRENSAHLGDSRKSQSGRGGARTEQRDHSGRWDISLISGLQMSRKVPFKQETVTWWPPPKRADSKRKKTQKVAFYRKCAENSPKRVSLLFAIPMAETGSIFSKADNIKVKCVWDIKCNERMVIGSGGDCGKWT